MTLDAHLTPELRAAIWAAHCRDCLWAGKVQRAALAALAATDPDLRRRAATRFRTQEWAYTQLSVLSQ
jgi:hypothetical protein